MYSYVLSLCVFVYQQDPWQVKVTFQKEIDIKLNGLPWFENQLNQDQTGRGQINEKEVNMCLHTNTHTHTHTRTHARTQTRTQTRTHAHIYASKPPGPAHTNTQKHTHKYTYTLDYTVCTDTNVFLSINCYFCLSQGQQIDRQWFSGIDKSKCELLHCLIHLRISVHCSHQLISLNVNVTNVTHTYM